MPFGQCEFIYDPVLDCYKLKFDFQGWNKQHKAFIDILKGTIPSSDREWNPATKTWFIQPQSKDGKDWFKILEIMIDATFSPVYKFSKEQTEQYKYGSTGSVKVDVSVYVTKFNKIVAELALPQINNGITLQEATKIYRKAAMSLHPDRNNGNQDAATKMSILNEAWANIKVEKFKQGASV